ncbi:MAG: 2'-5' RNA ligase family protein [Cyanobacteria bacterium]|nr:2'-5' RNA ligase family protein [Cyanobacteriota bacterium]MDA1021006.1 2'-5' RNA ligase family protein [Cyanobacteriota bacterium]
MIYKALDIVVIPPQPVLDLCYQLNAGFEDRRINLNPVNALPHLTLSMGVIESGDEAAIAQALEVLAKKYQGLELQFDSIFDAGFKTDSAMGLSIEKTDGLMNLHRDSVALMRPHLQDYYQADIFADYDQGLGESCLGWVRRFQSDCVGEDFDPHITIGFGDLPEIEAMSFKTSKLALYQLGDYCTCNKLIVEFEL